MVVIGGFGRELYGWVKVVDVLAHKNHNFVKFLFKFPKFLHFQNSVAILL